MSIVLANEYTSMKYTIPHVFGANCLDCCETVGDNAETRDRYSPQAKRSVSSITDKKTDDIPRGSSLEAIRSHSLETPLSLSGSILDPVFQTHRCQ